VAWLRAPQQSDEMGWRWSYANVIDQRRTSIPASRYSSFTGTGVAGRTLAVMWLSVSDTTLYLPTQRRHLDRMRNGQ
jgi:hypothetical protein